MINSEDYATSRLESWRTTSELNVPFFWLADQTLTLGMEWNHDQLDDPASMQATNSNGETIPGTSGDRNAVPKTTPPSPVSIWKIISKPCPAPT